MNQTPSWIPEEADLHTHTAPAKNSIKHNHPTRMFHTEKLLKNLLPSCSPSPALIFLVSLYKLSYFGSFMAGLPHPKPTHLSMDALRKDMLSGAKDSEQQGCLSCNHQQLELLSSPPDWRTLGATPWLNLLHTEFPDRGLGLSNATYGSIGPSHPLSPPRVSALSLLLLFCHQIESDSSLPCGLQHTRLPCPSPYPGVCPSSCPLNRWGHPAISSSVTLFSFCLQCFPASGSFPMSQLFASDGQSIGASACISPARVFRLISCRIDWFDLLAV